MHGCEHDPDEAPSGAESPWFLVYTKPRQEHIAHVNLQQQAYRTYLPLFKTLRKPRKNDTGEAQTAFEPMFARYVFFQPSSARQSIAAVRSTRGVGGIVSFGFKLAVVQPATLAAIRVCEQERNQADIAVMSPFQPGTQVRLSSPELRALQGIVQAVSGKRVTILLDILGRQKSLSVAHHQLELV